MDKMEYPKGIVYIGLFFGVLVLSMSCGSDDNQAVAEMTSVEEGRSLQLENLYDTQIEPLQEEHIALTENLIEVAKAFKEMPTTTSLANLKNSWSQAFMFWEQGEIYNIGVIRNSFVHAQIHEWPVNVQAIEGNIAGAAVIDEAYIASLGVLSKGYGAMEYLLFHTSEKGILSEMSSDENATNRLDYLVSLAENLNTNAKNLQELWKATASSFKTRLESGVNGSQNLAVNAVIAELETIKLRKLEQVINAPDSPELGLEAFFSETSREAILVNLEALKETYTGNFEGEGFGMEDYLVDVLDRSDLNDLILAKFDEAIALFGDTESSLKKLTKNDPEKIEVLRDAVTEIIALLKNDYSSAANIVVTFNDNDGD
ncbi:imelysin family protein [Zobellia galactanivorans]|uniref:Iron-regulated protein A n=1 Tax=Zobellia galactanivorans (strain DSM 12802 / CCUG 47099 / CIP 106680 / NCIMB 13871 / Dsij) TaxID=63186 RepID=G0L3R7_ZOBGA|nr:imelysin family protein [Zobellia galactanivorans]CAZ95419.1 Iron-regulated protein A [Zobellia galactanivorans]